VRDYRWPAPAKLNLFLHITARRADGYHELQTVFQLLDVGDRLHIAPRSDGLIHRLDALPGVAAEDDLCIRAAHLLRSACGGAARGAAKGADIGVDKRLPLGGGLGGGSSDAATVLLVLDQLWGCDLGIERLAELGARLGADVPVFVRGHSAWAEGVGERLQALDLPPRHYLVASPGVAVSTAEIFAAAELTRDCPPITIRGFLAGGGQNVCQPVVALRYPQVARLLDWLAARRQVAEVAMSGTGSSCYAAFDDPRDARRALGELPSEWRGFVARGVARSPLRCMLRS